MNEEVRAAAAEGEAPVNPYSLLAAVNSSSDTAHTSWLILIGIMSYLLVAVAGVTHKDLLLSNDLQLPILQVKIDLTRFFLFAPIVITLFHLGVVSQLVMLARKTLEFDNAIRMLEVSDRRTHPLRLELHNFFFVQAIAGPERSRVLSAFLHAMAWLTLAILPVILLLYVQVAFLPYHDIAITWAHRAALMADIALLVLIGIFLTRPEQNFFQAFIRTTREHPLSFGVTFAVLLVVAMFSFFVATIPGETLDRWGRELSGAARGTTAFQSERSAYGFTMPFLGQRADGTLLGIFERNLNVTDLDLVVDKDVTPGEPTLNLRGRDLRYARLDRTDLHQADLTGADLEGASLVGADLRGAFLHCADLSDFILSEDRQSAKCPNARRANFRRAKLKDARMAGIDLRGATLEDADLEGAELAYAAMTGANFYSAQLNRADLTGGVSLQGANFATAAMQGVDLTGARLYGADFSSAGLQGAVLAHAYLQGATLRDAELEGADLYKAKLQGADMRGAKLRAATLREASVWMTAPPDRESLQLTDMADLSVRPLDESDISDLKELLHKIADERLRRQVGETMTALMAPEARRSWSSSPADQQTWTSLAQVSTASLADGHKPRLTDFLSELACKTRWQNGGVATGIAKRALGIEFKGDVIALNDRLNADSCPASKTIPRRIMRSLATAVDIARGK
ncbi:MAG: pentapeptide repeat-containing protein [Hyphomicrobiaceae bacterium]